MTGNTRNISVTKINENGSQQTEAEVVREQSLSIRMNGNEYALISSSPSETDFLAVGFLQSQGLLDSSEDIQEIKTDQPGIVDVITAGYRQISDQLLVTSSGGRSRMYDTAGFRTESDIRVSPEVIFNLMEEFEQYSRDFKRTGGVHSAAMLDTEKIVVVSEDIGRHNAVDKVFGKCLLQGLDVTRLFLITSGRVSFDILLKAAKRKVPILIARNSPTDLGIEMADKAGITLLGFVRGTSMNAYTHAWRVV